MSSLIPVNAARLWDSMMKMGELGALPRGGCFRAALSDDDKHGRDLFSKWCREAGCEVAFDQVGNIFARRHGTDSSLPSVATGSHLDTQPHAGKFDGIYGVLAGLEVVRALNDADIRTIAPIDLVVWTNEEGVRFGPPLSGSSAFAGTVDVETVHCSKTLDGTTVKQDLERIGYLGDELPGSRIFKCFIEAHIEQGPILEAEGKTIGVVTQIQGIRWLRVSLHGMDSHAGTTPMGRRRDALLGAAKSIVLMNQLAQSQDEYARLTVGRIEVSPNSGATIPGHVQFNVDLRHPDSEVLDAMEEKIRGIIETESKSGGLEHQVERILNKDPVFFSGSLIDCVRQSALKCGLSQMDILSGAGHDAMNVARVAPTGMIFVPCKDGLSHNEAESATAEDLAAGTQTLLYTLLSQAGRADL